MTQTPGPTQNPASAKAVAAYLHRAGPRAYLLQGADFWALRDLKDLSQGAFSELPTWLARASDAAASLATSALVGR